MQRRKFIGKALAGGALAGGSTAFAAQPAARRDPEVFIERFVPGRPHAGKVLALVEPHLDDGPIFAGGTIAKLLKEGYTGYLIRTSNDEKDSLHLSLGETILANERDSRAFIKTIGMQQVFDLGYRNHTMDDVPRNELRLRLILLFRLLKVDTVFSYDPWGHYEENPDHYITAQAVEAACWMSGGRLDYPELIAAGLQPHAVREKYYFARGPQLVNRVVDIGPTIEDKMAAIRSNKTMIQHMAGDLKAELAARNLRLPALGDDDETMIREYTNLVFRRRDASLGQQYGLQYAEAFHHIGPDRSLDQYIAQNAVPLR
jgi:LmbE family N-acetylglucosaminyl deacetylase